ASRLTVSLSLHALFRSPTGVDGGISTSPLSYKYWDRVSNTKREVFQKATLQMIKIASRLYTIRQDNGQILHLDIEPEPDGLLERSEEHTSELQSRFDLV